MSSDRGTLSRPVSISPPPKRRRVAEVKRDDRLLDGGSQGPQAEANDAQRDEDTDNQTDNRRPFETVAALDPCVVASPVQLNYVEQLHSSNNVDTISLGSILGDVMIQECWLFNYLFDLDFVMSQFDADVKAMIKVHVVHGSWRREDTHKISLDEAAKRYPNVDVVTAYMSEAFGTHHSKMIVLFRHDNLAQVVILTGNFIQRDWSMSQAVWRSPLLPLLVGDIRPHSPTTAFVGSGLRFKYDLIAYLNDYGSKLKDLTIRLGSYDFEAVKAALVASTPGRQNIRSTDPETETLWGWPGLKHTLSNIRGQVPWNELSKKEMSLRSALPDKSAHIVIQVSSVASIGENWLSTILFPALAALKTKSGSSHDLTIKPLYSVVFPTPDEIRKSVNGYDSGASIHMKTQTPTQARQLSDIHPMLCRWAGDPDPAIAFSQGRAGAQGKARRGRAAPHIKTYIRFHDASMQHIDWAMVTSANLSIQAWGSAVSASGEVRICSYEIGVVFWPALWDDASDGTSNAKMVPVFGSDMPTVGARGMDEATQEGGSTALPELLCSEADKKRKERVDQVKEEMLVGWRMPYDLPLVPYSRTDTPWCAAQPCGERDWMGRTWPGYAK